MLARQLWRGRRGAQRGLRGLCSDSHDDFKPKYKPAVSSGSVEELIQEDISQNSIFLYMKGYPNSPMCGFSATVVEILKREGVSFASRNVLDNQEVREGIKRFSDWPTIPQLYVKGEFVGGCDVVVQLFKNGELSEMLSPLKSENKND